MTKVLIVDDHPVARRGLQALTEQALEVTGLAEAANGASAVSLAEAMEPDLIVLDLRIPEENAAAICKQLLRRAPRARVVVFTAFDDREEIRECLAAGAHGCLLKDTSEADVGDSLQRILAGETVIDPRIAERMALEYTRMLRGETVQLTPREREVLRLLAEGLSNRAIAERLSLAESTVKGYVATLRQKLGAASRLQAVVQADRAGLL